MGKSAYDTAPFWHVLQYARWHLGMEDMAEDKVSKHDEE